MDCLTNRIGIAGCDAPASAAIEASGIGVIPVVLAEPALPILLVNDLPGISLENISALTSNEHKTYLKLWDNVVRRTMKKFEVLVKVQINRCHQITSKDLIECLVCENVDLFDVALWYLHGTEIMIERTSTDEVSRFTTIDLDKAEKLKAEFYTEFSAALEDAVSVIDISSTTCDAGCVPCVDPVKWVMQTP